MPEEETIAILRELLAGEQTSLVTRLKESTAFISRASVTLVGAVESMDRAGRDSCAQLAQAILQRGGVPGPRALDPRSADLHFQELRFVLPRLIRDRETLIRRYDQGAERLTDDPEAAALVRRILERHREELGELQAFSSGQPADLTT